MERNSSAWSREEEREVVVLVETVDDASPRKLTAVIEDFPWRRLLDEILGAKARTAAVEKLRKEEVVTIEAKKRATNEVEERREVIVFVFAIDCTVVLSSLHWHWAVWMQVALIL